MIAETDVGDSSGDTRYLGGTRIGYRLVNVGG